MKAKNLFFGALACLAFAACSNDDEPVVNNGAQAEYACVTVQFSMPGGSSTRAWNDDADDNTYYKKGDDAEVTVSSARFFFFDASKNKCLEPETPASLGAATDGTNLTIDKVHGATIVLEDPTVTPAYIAVAINLPAGYAGINPATLDELTETLHDVVGTNTKLSGATAGTFVMTNSVFVNGSDVIQATPIEPAQIGRGKTPEVAATAAIAAPVKIAVERVLARVHVEGTSVVGNESVTFSGSATPTKIIPTIEGWWLDCTNKGSYLVKQLDATYSFNVNTGKTALSEGWWNDLGDSRSYWANAITSAGYGHYTYGTANNADKYCFENTATSTTKLVVAATLKDELGNPVDLIQWAAINFNGADAFNQYMATYYLKDKYLKSTDGGTTKAALTKDDFTFIYNTDETGESTLNEKDWQTRLGVKDDAATTYYLADGTEKTVAEMNNELKDAVGIFKFYNEGQTYYFTEIQHEPVYQETDFAIIRNHYYALNIQSITGLGTPVPNPEDEPTTDPTDPYFPDPEDPDDGTNPDPGDPDDPEDKPIVPELPENDHSAIAAQVQILKYRIVSQNVNLGQ